MIKTIVKILIVLVIVNGLYRTGMVAWDYFRLKDEAEQLIIFGARASVEDLHSRILAKADELEIPLAPENLDVRREGGRTLVYGSYQQPLEYFPNVTYPVDLSFAVDAFLVEGLK